MIRARNNVHRPIGPQVLQRFHIPMAAWIFSADDHGHRNFHSFYLRFADRELGKGFWARGRDGELSPVEFIPDTAQPRARFDPAHAAEDHSIDAVGMHHRKFHRDHSTHGIARDARGPNVQVIHEAHDVFNHVRAVSVFRSRFARSPMSATIQRDDFEMFRKQLCRARQFPVDPAICIKTVNKNHRLAKPLDGVMNFHASRIKIVTNNRTHGR